jgi:hypothetical protein
MASVPEIANLIIKDFDRRNSITVERAATQAIVALDGVSVSEAAALAESKASAVLGALAAMDPRELPFELSMRASNRLIGKERVRPDDTEEARTVRGRLHLVAPFVEALLQLGDRCFEFVSAATMRLAGAVESVPTGSGDEGGIDFYGRIPIRPASPLVERSVLATSILERNLLFLGQSKCVGSSVEIQRSVITQFNSDVEYCRQKYEGVSRKPSNRVPEAYYRTGETCLKIFITTGKFAPGAVNFASASDMATVNGRQLAEFLIFHGVGIRVDEDSAVVDPDLIANWARWPEVGR